MFKGPRRLVPLAGSALVLVIVAATGAYLLLPPRQTADVAVPAPDATPEQVVTAYLNALNAHDCGSAETVTTGNATDEAKSWCRDVSSVMVTDVDNHVLEPPEMSGNSPTDQVANVSVTFTPNWRRFHHNDGSEDQDVHTWGYWLVRGSAQSPWRIFDQGFG